MSFPNLQVTNSGKAMMLAVLSGAPLVFTKIVLGNGNQPANQDVLTAVQNPQAEGTIDSYTRDDTIAKVHWSLDSQTVVNGFDWTEYGLYASSTLDENDEVVPGSDVLFSYAYNEGSPQPIAAGNAETPIQIEADINIAVGTAKNVNAVVSEYSAYASKEDFNTHISERNPHGTRPEDIGLSNVDNTSDSGAIPSFEEAETLVTINSGETASTLWGKVKKLFTSFIAHLSANNPHAITPSKIGASATGHKHSAGDITSGVLSVANGGTGGNTGNISMNSDGTYSAVSANKYRSVRTLALSPGKWLCLLTLSTDNWGGAGNVEVFLTGEAYTSNVAGISAYSQCNTEVYLDGSDSYKSFTVPMIINQVSTSQKHIVTVKPSRNSRWKCYWNAIRII
ncbi:MAG: hypothetical protein IJ643_11660 [Eubacterium sp.]|nr:hypothetical protein [Eubacterium sp.]